MRWSIAYAFVSGMQMVIGFTQLADSKPWFALSTFITSVGLYALAEFAQRTELMKAGNDIRQELVDRLDNIRG